MKSKSAIVLCAAFLAALGLGLFTVDALSAQGETPAKTDSRYQISAYAGTAGGSVHHGCYVLDTATGQVWHTRLGGDAEKVAKVP
jgi:hypothetical protein